MLAKVKTSAISGISAVTIEVEAEIKNSGQPRFIIIGLGDNAVKESKDRVYQALKNSGFQVPEQILINLSPAELKKEGSAFDLPIALAILLASGQLDPSRLIGVHLHGELALDGRIKPVRGVLAYSVEALRQGASEIIVPPENGQEALLCRGLTITSVESLSSLVAYFRGDFQAPKISAPHYSSTRHQRLVSQVIGQQSAKRALIIAAAGAHNLLMVGPPGCGKSMLAERFPSLLPPMSSREIMEVIQIHSVAGLEVQQYLNGGRPFRSPHHGISEAGLIGGGSSPRPGEISLAHQGVLFLDEFPEFRRNSLESLRGPVESGQVHIARAKGSLILPSRFQLIAAMNPCPCGRLGSAVLEANARNELNRACNCSRGLVLAYLRKLSQPILDRIDIHVELEAVPLSLLTDQTKKLESEQGTEELLRDRVQQARARQLLRSQTANAFLSTEQLKKALPIKPQALTLLELAAKKRGLSARGYLRVLRVALTIADLDESPCISEKHTAEAVALRSLEKIQEYCLPKASNA